MQSLHVNKIIINVHTWTHLMSLPRTHHPPRFWYLLTLSSRSAAKLVSRSARTKSNSSRNLATTSGAEPLDVPLVVFYGMWRQLVDASVEPPPVFLLGQTRVFRAWMVEGAVAGFCGGGRCATQPSLAHPRKGQGWLISGVNVPGPSCRGALSGSL